MQQLKKKINSFNFFSLEIDESTDVYDSAQLLIFIRGIDDNFNVYEELVDLCSVKGTTTGEDLFVDFDKLLYSLEYPNIGVEKISKCNNRWWENHQWFK